MARDTAYACNMSAKENGCTRKISVGSGRISVFIWGNHCCNKEQRNVFLTLTHFGSPARVWGKKKKRRFNCFPQLIQKLRGRGCSSVGRASDRHADDAGSIPRCGKGFFSQSTFSADSLTCVRNSPVCNHVHQHLCAH